jgi:hypothetical protein
MENLPANTYEITFFTAIGNDPDTYQFMALATSAVDKSGGFSLTIPKTVPGKFLYRYTDDAPPSITFSDTEVLTANGGFYMKDLSGRRYEVFYDSEVIEGETSHVESYYSFFSSAIDATGYYDDYGRVVNMDIHAKKGWNVIYHHYGEESQTMTTTPPAGYNMSYFVSL